MIIITTDNNNNTEASYALAPSRSNFFIFAELTYTLGQWNSKKEGTETNFQTRDLRSQWKQWTIVIHLILNLILTN